MNYKCVKCGNDCAHLNYHITSFTLGIDNQQQRGPYCKTCWEKLPTEDGQRRPTPSK